MRRVRRETGMDRLASIGDRSVILPPALIIGHHLIHIGSGCRIHARSFISVVDEHDGKRYDARLTIGDRLRAGFDLVIACCGHMEIGDDVLMADRVYIGDTYHEYRDVTRPVLDQGLGDPRPVSIGSGSFLGINSAVLPGVTIGEGGYVAANAVVTSDVPPRSLVAGNPARVVRRWDGNAWVDVPSRARD